MPTVVRASFDSQLLRFFQELERNNRREWFEANKPRYEETVKAPFQRFVADVGARMRTIGKQFGEGSVFRIHRDTRFSRDKSPYKTHAAAHFPNRAGGREVHAPGFYLHLEPGGSRGGGGVWQPDPPALRKVRDRIVARAGEWKQAVARIELLGDALKRPPAGYDADHPFVADLKRKEFYTMTEFSDREVSRPDFLERYLDACRRAAPLVRFLTKAVGLPW